MRIKGIFFSLAVCAVSSLPLQLLAIQSNEQVPAVVETIPQGNDSQRTVVQNPAIPAPDPIPAQNKIPAKNAIPAQNAIPQANRIPQPNAIPAPNQIPATKTVVSPN